VTTDLSRRGFLVGSSLYGGALWLAIAVPRRAALRAAEPEARPEVLSLHEWRTVEAISARIIPTDEEPGAVEAGCVNFVDKALAREDSQALVLYRLGLVGLDVVAGRSFGKPFVELAPGQQDEVLGALESGRAEGWPPGPVAAPVFFETLRAHTIVGFLADPKYGGNRGYAGWRVVRYPGPRHHRGGYSREQMLGEEKIDAVWGESL
jgi:gluconate 2-dehydrogenase gamma chain